jgi:hypothetical protein
MGVVLAAAILLVAVFWAVILVVMIRASNAQRGRTKRTDFGGRYTSFGFLLGVLRDDERREQSGKRTGRTLSSDEAGRSRR